MITPTVITGPFRGAGAAKVRRSQRQDQSQGQSQIGINTQTQGIKGSANNSAYNDQTVAPSQQTNITTEVPNPAPAVFAPALAVAPETCMGSTSVGGSVSNGVIGVGIGVGSTWKSEDCERRMYARSLQALGQPQAALYLLAQNENVKKALQQAGVKLAGLEQPAAPAPATAQTQSVGATPTGTPVTPAVASPDPAKVTCRGNQVKMRAAITGEWFCLDR